MDDNLISETYYGGYAQPLTKGDLVKYYEALNKINDRLSALEKRSGLLSSSLSRQLWALFGRLVLLWIILGSVWLLGVIVVLGLSGG